MGAPSFADAVGPFEPLGSNAMVQGRGFAHRGTKAQRSHGFKFWAGLSDLSDLSVAQYSDWLQGFSFGGSQFRQRRQGPSNCWVPTRWCWEEVLRTEAQRHREATDSSSGLDSVTSVSSVAQWLSTRIGCEVFLLGAPSFRQRRQGPFEPLGSNAVGAGKKICARRHKGTEAPAQRGHGFKFWAGLSEPLWLSIP